MVPQRQSKKWSTSSLRVSVFTRWAITGLISKISYSFVFLSRIFKNQVVGLLCQKKQHVYACEWVIYKYLVIKHAVESSNWNYSFCLPNLQYLFILYFKKSHISCDYEAYIMKYIGNMSQSNLLQQVQEIQPCMCNSAIHWRQKRILHDFSIP